MLTVVLNGPSGAEYGSDNSLRHDHWRLPIPLQGDVPAYHIADARDLSAHACGACHAKQYEAWQVSFHHRATSAGLMGQLGALDPEEALFCLRCHAPRSEQQEVWESTRSATPRDLGGVDCAACHVREHVRYGPRDMALTPHGPVQKLELFNESAFCAPCHQFDEEGLSVNGKPLENTYEEWRASRYAREGITCQTCHMKDGRHDFAGIHDREMTQTGLKIEAERIATGIRLRARNAGAGHALPTYITPRIRILLHEPGRSETPLREYIIQRRMIWNIDTGWREISDTRLLPDQVVELVYPLDPGHAVFVSVVVEPDADYHERIYPALMEMLADTLTPSQHRLLKTAEAESGRSSYVLYCLQCGPRQKNDTPCVRQSPGCPACSRGS
jgi:hypothetical protein